MKTLTLRKIFTSQAKPKLYVPSRGPSLIWKTGDNLFADLSVMFMGEYLNHLWSKHKVNIQMQTYGIFPCGSDRGFIECVDNVCAVREYDFEQLKCSDSFLASLSGACLIGWVLGIRDRHQDNQLIVSTKSDNLVLPIDFGFLFNTGPMIDAPRISFPNRMVEQMRAQKTLKKFVLLTVSGFEVLWDNQEAIMRLGEYLFPVQFCQYFFSKDSFFALPKSTASSSFETKLKKRVVEGKGLKHWLKDMAHNSKISLSNSRLSPSMSRPTGI